MKTHSPRFDQTARCNRRIRLTDLNSSTEPTCVACRNFITKAILTNSRFRTAQLAGVAALVLLLLAQLAGCGEDGTIGDPQPSGQGGQVAVDGQPQHDADPPAIDGQQASPLACPLGVTSRQDCSLGQACPNGQICKQLYLSCRDGAGQLWTRTCVDQPPPAASPRPPACSAATISDPPCGADSDCPDQQTTCQAVLTCQDKRGQTWTATCRLGDRLPTCGVDVLSQPTCRQDGDCINGLVCRHVQGTACKDRNDQTVTLTCQAAT